MKFYKKLLLFGFIFTITGLFSLGCSAVDSLTEDADASVFSDITTPTVIETNPTTLAIGIERNRNIIIAFSENMATASITTDSITLTQGSLLVVGSISYANAVATFTPSSQLDASTLYTLMVSTDVKDAAGNALETAYTSTFTTGTTTDTTAPTVGAFNPMNLSTEIAVTAQVSGVFSEPMDPTTLTSTTFTLKEGLNDVSGTVSYASQTATFTPTGDLEYDTTYTAKISTGAKDLAGNALVSTQTWTFTTEPALILGPATVNLGTAGNFAILSKTGISAVPPCAIVGHMAVSPIDATAITGFSLILDSTTQFSTSSQVTGLVYAANYTSPTPATLTTAISDMLIAYTDAEGRTTPDFIELGAGNISGMTLLPGLYKWSSSLLINADITLSGGPDDVFILQIAGDITLANGVSIHLSGGAQAKNIFWQTASAVSIGSGSHFEGIILAKTQIDLNTGGTINGRLLSQTAVTLISNTVTEPTE